MPGQAGRGSLETARLDTEFLGGAIVGCVDEICCGPVTFADSFDEVGAAIEDTSPVVGGISGGQGVVPRMAGASAGMGQP
jgi:hypothetical protein